jgi:signal transduction histidine kinase
MDVAYDVNALAAAKLVVYSLGALVHLFLMILIVSQRRRGYFEWLLFWLMAGLFMWNAGNLLSVNISLAYGAGPAALEAISRLIPFVGFIITVPLIVHVHLEYAYIEAGVGGSSERRPLLKYLLVALFYLPLIANPGWIARLVAEWRFESLVALGPWERPLAIWMVLALGVASAANACIFLRNQHSHLTRFHLWLALLEAVLAVGLFVALVVPPPPSSGLGGFPAVALMGLAIVPSMLAARFVFRYQLFHLEVQRSLVYTLVTVFAILVYLAFIRRLSDLLAARHILPLEVTDTIMIFLLVVLLEPIKQAFNRLFEGRFQSELARVQSLIGEIQDEALRNPDLERLKQIIEREGAAELGLGQISLTYGDRAAPFRGSEGSPARWFQVMRGGRTVANLVAYARDEAELAPDQAAALQVFADQLGAAIELCRLVGEKVKLERELADRAKMAFLGEMAARIAHNVKNPLSAMKTLVQLLEEDPRLDPALLRDCRMIVGEIDRLNANVSQVLRYAKPARAVDRPVDLTAVVRQVLEIHRAEAERRGVVLELRSAGEPCLVTGGEEATGDIVSNLVVNAIEATAREAEMVREAEMLDVSAGNPSAACRSAVSVQIARSSGADAAVELWVEDHGPGVPEDVKDRIFQAFFTTRPGGTGLGLAIVARRAEEAGGSVACTSPIDARGGARFVVKFRAA